MSVLLRVAAIVALSFLVPLSAQAFDRSQCKQYGGPNDCWTPIIGEWDYNICVETGPYHTCAAMLQGRRPRGSEGRARDR